MELAPVMTAEILEGMTQWILLAGAEDIYLPHELTCVCCEPVRALYIRDEVSSVATRQCCDRSDLTLLHHLRV
jgi:hypothetical protein